MASSEDGQFIFLAIKNCINVYKLEDFSSKNPPEPSTFFPFTPFKVLRPTNEQVSKIRARNTTDPHPICFNHIRAGWITKNQETLVAVGENGLILVWDLKNLDDQPILMDTFDFASTWGIASCRNNSLLAVSSNSHSVTIFHYPSKRIIFHAEPESESEQIHIHNIPSLDFSPCGKYLASCSIDGSVGVWSISDETVTKMTHRTNKEWGWLVRFVSPHQYCTQESKSKKVIKSYYHSNVKEIPLRSPDDFDEEIYRNSQMVLERLTNFFGSDIEHDDTEFEELSEIESDENDLESGAHLAEGAGDTWPEEYNSDLGYTPYDSDDFSNYSDSEEMSEDQENDRHEHELSDNLNESSEGLRVLCDSETVNLNSSSSFKCSQIKINFNDIKKDESKEPAVCPYDLVYCTSKSFFILNPVTGSIKLSVPKLVQTSLQSQNENINFDNSSNYFLQNRLGMGEWIPELSVFLVIDCNGPLIIISASSTPNSPTNYSFSSILLPDIFPISNEVIGYTVIRRIDEEFGVKVHVYLLQNDGIMRLYEIVKK